jgi:polyketide synthase 12/myxalamid-type polyketide synthase MxaB
VIHAAGILDDGVLAQLDWARFSRVMAPKVAGAWNLHTLTEGMDLDFFVLFSSVASVLGSPGQGNYAAANAFLDALAHFRRARGLAGLSVNWGAWAEAGMAARQQGRERERRTEQGLGTIPSGQGMAALARLLSQERAQVAVVPIDWPRLIARIPEGQVPPLLSRFAATHRIGAPGSQGRAGREREEILGASREERPRRLDVMLRQQAARVLGIDEDKLDARASLGSMGLDSLMAVEIRNAIEARTGVSLPIAVFLEGPSLGDLQVRLLAALDEEGAGRDATAEPVGVDSVAAAALLARVDEISDAEVEALLGQMLPEKREKP